MPFQSSSTNPGAGDGPSTRDVSNDGGTYQHTHTQREQTYVYTCIKTQLLQHRRYSGGKGLMTSELPGGGAGSSGHHGLRHHFALPTLGNVKYLKECDESSILRTSA